MAKQIATRRAAIRGHALTCPVCSHERFWLRFTQLNTAGMTFLGLDFANRTAMNLVCGECSHMLWFHEESGLEWLDGTPTDDAADGSGGMP